MIPKNIKGFTVQTNSNVKSYPTTMSREEATVGLLINMITSQLKDVVAAGERPTSTTIVIVWD